MNIIRKSYFRIFLGIIFVLFFVLCCGTYIWSIHKNFKKYLKEETYLRLLDKEKFRLKLKKPPQWMVQEIQEDFDGFSNISKDQVDKTYKIIQKNYPHPNYIRYRIIDNQLYRCFKEGEKISLIDNSIEKSIKTLLHIRSINDLDLIISFDDGIPLSCHPTNFYCTEKKEEQAPILCSAKLKNTPYVILIPDWRSVGEWWANDLKQVIKANKTNFWVDKKDYGFWRGSLTNQIRHELCKISIKYPEYLDAKINIRDQSKEIQIQFEKEGIYSDLTRVPWNYILKNKYLPLVDGVMTASPAFQARLISNSLTLKQEFDGFEWFYRELKPYVHYVPLKKDLSNLISQIEWMKKNDDLCQKIVQNANEFAQNNLMMEDVYLYFYLVLNKYSSLQELNRKQILKEIAEDPNWININERYKLKKNIKNNRSNWIEQPTPY